MKTCTILGTEIAVTTMEETVRYIEEHMEELRGKYICVSNVHTTVTAYEDESYRKVQNGAAFALPDGKPLSLYSKKHGFPEAERVTGPDLMGELFARDNGLTHYFYGGSEATIRTLRVAAVPPSDEGGGCGAGGGNECVGSRYHLDRAWRTQAGALHV